MFICEHCRKREKDSSVSRATELPCDRFHSTIHEEEARKRSACLIAHGKSGPKGVIREGAKEESF